MTILSFIFAVLLPFYAQYNTAAAFHDASENTVYDLNEKVLICTPQGLKWVSWNDLQHQDTSDTHTQPECGACYLSAFGLDRAAVTAHILFAGNVNTLHIQSHAITAHIKAAAYNYNHSRAPPVLI